MIKVPKRRWYTRDYEEMNYERVVRSVYLAAELTFRGGILLVPIISFFLLCPFSLHPPPPLSLFLSFFPLPAARKFPRGEKRRGEEKRREGEEELREARSPVKAFALKLRNFGRKFARQVRTIGKTSAAV